MKNVKRRKNTEERMKDKEKEQRVNKKKNRQIENRIGLKRNRHKNNTIPKEKGKKENGTQKTDSGRVVRGDCGKKMHRASSTKGKNQERGRQQRRTAKTEQVHEDSEGRERK